MAAAVEAARHVVYRGPMPIVVEVLFISLAGVGLYISSYFTALSYRVVQPHTRWVPSICRLDAGRCESVVHTPQARLLGVPNSVLGMGYYLALLVAAPTGLLTQPWILDGFLLAALVTLALAVVLIRALYVVLRTPCPLCLTSHALNIVLAALLIWLRVAA